MTILALQERLLARQGTWDTMIEALEVEHVRHTLRDGGPSIAWLVGHMTHNAHEVARALGGPGAGEVPGQDLDAPHAGVTDEDTWRMLEGEWRRACALVRTALAGLDDEQLELAPAVAIHPGFEDGLATRRAFLEGHLFHLTWHAGQVGMLRAALGLGWA